MKQINAVLLVMVLLVAVSLPIQTRAETPVPLISPDEIEIGQQGYGLTVFCGTEPVKFAVEALGVLRNVFPGRDLILIRAYGPEVEKGGIYSGMSGSPVYFDGRLAGAVAYSWMYQKEPIGLVTVAEDMLAIWSDDGVIPKVGVSSGPLRGDNSPGLQPIRAPLVIGGLSPQAFQEVGEFFGQYDLYPLQGGGAAGPGGLGEESLVPGAAFGVQLARGDVDFTAIGTVTWREGDRLIGFGHPMFQLMEGEYPLVTARILALNPSYADSFKIGVGVEEVGTINLDYAAGVAGEIGPLVSMIPITLKVVGPTYTKTYNVESIRHPYMLFPLTASVVSSALDQQFGRGDMVCRFRSTVKFENYPEVIIEDALYSPGFPNIYRMLLPLLLEDNPWEELRPEWIDIEVTAEPGRGFAELVEVSTDHLEVRPGEEVEIIATLAPYDAPLVEVPLTFTVPDWLDDGTALRVHIGPANEVMSRPPLRDMETVLQVLQELGAGDLLQATVFLPRQISYYEGRPYPDLPASIGEVLSSPTRLTVGNANQPVFLQQRAPAGYVVTGNNNMQFMVKK